MTKRSAEHVKAQREGKQRDLDTCQICGGRDKVQGHHIFDVQYGGAANKENIVTLCNEHHKKVHSGKIEVDIF